MKNPIFLGGCGSSGTTLLRKMLNAHPRIACGPEMSVFDRPKMFEISLDWLYTMWRNQDFEDLEYGCVFPLKIQPHNTTYCGLSHENHMRFYHNPEEVEAMFDQAETVPGFLDVFFGKYASDRGKERWAEKTPNNIFTGQKILEAYPDGKFIELVRDGRDVVLSLFQRRQYSTTFVAIWRWLAAVEAGLRLRKSVDPRRAMMVKYEDLVQRTEFMLMNICAFLGERYEPDMMKYWEIKHEEDEEGDYGTQPVFTDSIGKWKSEDIRPEIIERMDLTMRSKLRLLDYETHG